MTISSTCGSSSLTNPETGGCQPNFGANREHATPDSYDIHYVSRNKSLRLLYSVRPTRCSLELMIPLASVACMRVIIRPCNDAFFSELPLELEMLDHVIEASRLSLPIPLQQSFDKCKTFNIAQYESTFLQNPNWRRCSMFKGQSFETGASNSDGCSLDRRGSLAGDFFLGRIHVSCYITSANRATPIFEILPKQNCVRTVSKPTTSASSGTDVGGINTVSTEDGKVRSSAADWNFDMVFPPSSRSHAMNFFTEITLPALSTARDGINSNIVTWGVHPTQKFRLLFGKNGDASDFSPQPEMALEDVVGSYGQLVGLIHAFFCQSDLGPRKAQSSNHPQESWRLSISSWIIVNNHSIDLLEPAGETFDTLVRDSSTSFASWEASSLATAFEIVQTAKTNRIIRRYNAEYTHFFVRITLCNDSRVSTAHFADLVDVRDFQDQQLNQEKIELFELLRGINQPRRPIQNNKSEASPVTNKRTLSRLVRSLLTVNSKTFFYINVIDSRTSLRESMDMMNAVTSLRDCSIIGQRSCGKSSKQLEFQPSFSEQDSSSGQTRPAKDAVPLVPPCVLTSPKLFDFQSAALFPEPTTPHGESEAMSWLSTFKQRKLEILGGSIDSFPTLPATNMVRKSGKALVSTRDNHQRNEVTPEIRSDSFENERLCGSSSKHDEIVLVPEANPYLSYCSQRSLPCDHSIPDTNTPLPIDDQQQMGYANSSSTVDGFDRHESGRPLQELDDLSKRPSSTKSTADETSSQSSSARRQKASAMEAYLTRPSLLSDAVSLSVPEIKAESQMDLSRRSLSTKYTANLPSETRSPSSSVPRQKGSVMETGEMYLPSLLSDVVSLALPEKMTEGQKLEMYKKAGVPVNRMKPPNVNGLDSKTAERILVADAMLLRKNYDALLSVVREQQHAKKAAEARATEALQDQEEQRTMYEVQIENMKLENLGLRSKVRGLESLSLLPHVFEQYEQELHKLQTQIHDLQIKNVALELQISGFDAVGGGLNGPSVDIKKKYQRAMKEKQALEREIMEHRKRERHLQVRSRLADESTRRVDKLSRDLSNTEEHLAATRLSKKRLNTEMNHAREKADQLYQENEKLQQEKAATTEELLATRMFIASLENEKRKASILDRFVEKHGDRLNKMRQRGHSCSGLRGEKNWHRNQSERDCEDNLLAMIKRSLPQAVPLCNKLMNRLEMQELSLRELSDREVDFINLLVELVSDQPSLILKQMIEQEMKKLQ